MSIALGGVGHSGLKYVLMDVAQTALSYSHLLFRRVCVCKMQDDKPCHFYYAGRTKEASNGGIPPPLRRRYVTHYVALTRRRWRLGVALATLGKKWFFCCLFFVRIFADSTTLFSPYCHFVLVFGHGGKPPLFLQLSWLSLLACLLCALACLQASKTACSSFK